MYTEIIYFEMSFGQLSNMLNWTKQSLVEVISNIKIAAFLWLHV